MSLPDTSKSFSLPSNENKTLLKSASHLAYTCSRNSWKNILSVWCMDSLTLDILSNEVCSEDLFDTVTPLPVLYLITKVIFKSISIHLHSCHHSLILTSLFGCNGLCRKKYFRTFYFKQFSYLVFQLYAKVLCGKTVLELEIQNQLLPIHFYFYLLWWWLLLILIFVAKFILFQQNKAYCFREMKVLCN